MTQPLVFMFHAGQHVPHVREAIRLLRGYTTDCRIVFAGTDAPEGLEFFDISRASDDHTFLEQHFAHTTVNPKWWEVYAMWRWFVLARLIKDSAHSGPVVCLDSDVFVFDDPGKVLARFGGSFGFGADANPPTTFFREAATVGTLCDLIASAVSDPKMWQHIAETVGDRLLSSFGGGLQEMGLIRYFCMKAKESGAAVSSVHEVVEGGVYDYAIAQDQPGFPMLRDDFGKVTIWKDGQPHFLPRDGGEPIQAFTLHIQGGAKRYWYRWLPKQ